MEAANYTLKFNEGRPVEAESAWLPWLRWAITAVWVIYSVNKWIKRGVTFGSVITFLILLIILIVWSFIGGKAVRKPFPAEFRFYDDYFVFYSEKRYFDRNNYKQEYYKTYYNDLTSCEYDNKYKQIYFYGDMQFTAHKYDKNGVLLDKPEKDKLMKNFGFYINLDFIEDIDIVSEITKHSPIVVQDR